MSTSAKVEQKMSVVVKIGRVMTVVCHLHVQWLSLGGECGNFTTVPRECSASDTDVVAT